MGEASDTFRVARDFLLANRTDYDTAYRDFRWPALVEFNWALDWFDAVLAVEQAGDVALHVIRPGGEQSRSTFAELSARSNQVANLLRAHGMRRGDRLLLMLGNQPELWETMLAAMKLGAMIIPASTLLGPADIADRVARGDVRHVVTTFEQAPKFAGVAGEYTRIVVGEGFDEPTGWVRYDDAWQQPTAFSPEGLTRASDPLLLYFTSGTTAQPKLVEHTHASYPIGHLSTMYWIGLTPGDVHLNVSSPGWAKHAWSSVFAPWNAGATVLVYDYARFAASALLDVLVTNHVTALCAPPTVYRMLVQEELPRWRVSIREIVGAGEPLNPEVIEQVRRAWNLTVRDGYGQTETTAQIGNSPGQRVKPGLMGRPLPGYAITLLDAEGHAGNDGEICLDLAHRPLALMTGYRDDDTRSAQAMRDGYYHTGDVASRDADGYITYVGRADDVFKASDYRISPFELESVLVEHPAVAEAAVVPSPDPIRLAVPKAYVVLAAGYPASAETARDILAFARERLAPYKRVRRLEFGELPKTISGKIRRVELKADASHEQGHRGVSEFWEEDFSDLKS